MIYILLITVNQLLLIMSIILFRKNNSNGKFSWFLRSSRLK